MRYDRDQGPLHRLPANKRARVTIPKRASPHVRLVFAEMGRLGRTYDELETASGVRRAALKAWRHKNYPSLQSIEAVLASLGWSFVPVPAIEVMPPEVAGDLAMLAAKLKVDIPETWAALIDVAARQREVRSMAARTFAELDTRSVV